MEAKFLSARNIAKCEVMNEPTTLRPKDALLKCYLNNIIELVVALVKRLGRILVFTTKYYLRPWRSNFITALSFEPC